MPRVTCPICRYSWLVMEGHLAYCEHCKMVVQIAGGPRQGPPRRASNRPLPREWLDKKEREERDDGRGD